MTVVFELYSTTWTTQARPANERLALLEPRCLTQTPVEDWLSMTAAHARAMLAKDVKTDA